VFNKVKMIATSSQYFILHVITALLHVRPNMNLTAEARLYEAEALPDNQPIASEQ